MKKIRYVVAYDIRDNRKRNRVFKLLRSYGIWAERSVFECELSPSKLERLRADLVRLMDPETDTLRIYRLTPMPEAIFAYGRVLERVPRSGVLIL